MFWIPKGWVPYYAEWLLSFPRAPLGSISIQAWALACGAIILLTSDAIAAVVALVMTPRTIQTRKEEPMKSQSEKAGPPQTPEKSKKEL
jgi:tail-anchored protein insertion receptor